MRERNLKGQSALGEMNLKGQLALGERNLKRKLSLGHSDTGNKHALQKMCPQSVCTGSSAIPLLWEGKEKATDGDGMRRRSSSSSSNGFLVSSLDRR